MNAQVEVIDFSFYVTEPAYAWAAMQFIVNGYAIPGILVLSPTESKRAIVEAHSALFAAANLIDPSGELSQRLRVALAAMPIVADGGGSIASVANDERRRLIRCLCHLLRNLGAGSLQAVIVRPVLWAYTREEVAREQRKAVLMIDALVSQGTVDEEDATEMFQLMGVDPATREFGPCEDSVAERFADDAHEVAFPSTNNNSEGFHAGRNAAANGPPQVKVSGLLVACRDRRAGFLPRVVLRQAKRVSDRISGRITRVAVPHPGVRTPGRCECWQGVYRAACHGVCDMACPHEEPFPLELRAPLPVLRDQAINHVEVVPVSLDDEWLEVWKRRVAAAHDKELADIADEETAPPESAPSPKWRLARQIARELRELGSTASKKANAPFFVDGLDGAAGQIMNSLPETELDDFAVAEIRATWMGWAIAGELAKKSDV
jgi:hypothetical protein